MSCVLAWAMEFWFCAYWTSCTAPYTHPDYNIIELFANVLLIKIAVSAVTNGM